MKKLALLFFSILFTAAIFADSIVLDNQLVNFTHDKATRITILWSTSAKNVEEVNKMIMDGKKLNLTLLQIITKTGRVHLDIPKKSEYFRVLAWSKNAIEPRFLTNWVDIIPNKTYILKQDDLIPRALMSGMGC